MRWLDWHEAISDADRVGVGGRKKKYGINLDEGMDPQMQKQKDEV